MFGDCPPAGGDHTLVLMDEFERQALSLPTYGERVAGLMALREMRPVDLQRAVGVDKTNYPFRWLAAEKAPPKYNDAIAAALSVDPFHLAHGAKALGDPGEPDYPAWEEYKGTGDYEACSSFVQDQLRRLRWPGPPSVEDYRIVAATLRRRDES